MIAYMNVSAQKHWRVSQGADSASAKKAREREGKEEEERENEMML